MNIKRNDTNFQFINISFILKGKTNTRLVVELNHKLKINYFEALALHQIKGRSLENLLT